MRAENLILWVLGLASLAAALFLEWDPRNSPLYLTIAGAMGLFVLIESGLQRYWLGDVDRLAEIAGAQRAEREGFGFRFPGRVGGRSGDVFVSASVGEGQFTYTFEATVPVHADLDAEFRQVTAITRLEKWLGAQALEIGDRGFDSRFEIHTSDRETLRRALTPAVRQAILLGQAHAVHVEKGRVVLEHTLRVRGKRSEKRLGQIAGRLLSVSALLAEGIEAGEAKSVALARSTLRPPPARLVGPAIGTAAITLLIWYCWFLLSR